MPDLGLELTAHNAFAALTPAVQVGVSYQYTHQVFGDRPSGRGHPESHNHRGERGFRLFFWKSRHRRCKVAAAWDQSADELPPGVRFWSPARLVPCCFSPPAAATTATPARRAARATRLKSALTRA